MCLVSARQESFAYTYDADGDEIQEVEQIGSATTNIPTETTNYTYNADGMLYSEVATPSGPGQGSTLEQWAIYYGYDADGNRLETDGGDFLNGQGDEEQANFWTYNANNELTNSITYNPDQDNPSNTFTSYSHDPNGNETEIVSYTEHQQQEDGDDNDSDQNYTYDVRGEMVKYVDQNNTTTTYTYDDAGNRVKEVTPVSGHNVTTTYLADPENPQGYAQTIEEHTNGAAVPSITYFVGLNGTQGQTNGSTVIYMLRDNRGYARIFTNASGAVTQYDQYDAYGNQTTPNNIPTTHYFPDGVLDPASGLTFHFGGRQSNSGNGDFIEQDGQGYGDNQNPISLNRYTYASDDPISMIDPSGHDSLGEALVNLGGGIITAVRIGVGAPVSVLDGDIFHYSSKLPTNPVVRAGASRVTIFIPGIQTSGTGELQTLGDIQKIRPGRQIIGVSNPTGHLPGIGLDLLQSAAYEFGAIDITAIRAAQTIQSVASQLGPNGTIEIIAHSQGAAVFAVALTFLSPQVRAMLDVVTVGGQRWISNRQGLRHVMNIYNPYDIVPRTNDLPIGLVNRALNLQDYNIRATSSNDPFPYTHYFGQYLPALKNESGLYQ